jgi:Bacteriophage HK97-gp10, putative tail-component
VANVRIVWDEAAVALIPEDPTVLALMDHTAGRLVSAMKREAPVSPVGSLHDSGHLRRSCQAFRQDSGSIIIGPTASYSSYVIEGTRPHAIRSHGNYPLRNRETGQIFGKEVMHPGTKPNNFLERALLDVAAEGDAHAAA